MLLVLAVIALSARTYEDPLPLVLPQIKRPASQPASAPVVTVVAPKPKPPPAPPKPLKESRVQLGAKVQGSAGSSAVIGGVSGALELSFRFPVLAYRLGLIIEPSVGQLYGRGSSLFVAGGSLLFAYQEPVGRALLRVSAGPTVAYAKSGFVDGDDRFADALVSIGATGGAGFLWPLGYGAIVVEARYRVLPFLLQGSRVASHGAVVSVGYDFFL